MSNKMCKSPTTSVNPRSRITSRRLTRMNSPARYCRTGYSVNVISTLSKTQCIILLNGRLLSQGVITVSRTNNYYSDLSFQFKSTKF